MLQNFNDTNVFWDKKVKTQQHKKSDINPLPELGIEPGTSATPSQLRDWIVHVFKLFNCFNVIGRNVNNKAEFAGHTFSTNSFFL